VVGEKRLKAVNGMNKDIEFDKSGGGWLVWEVVLKMYSFGKN